MILHGVFETDGYVFEAHLPNSSEDAQEWLIRVKRGENLLCERRVPLHIPISFDRPDLDELYGPAISFADRGNLESETDKLLEELREGKYNS